MRKYYIVSFLGDSKQEIRQISLSQPMVWTIAGLLIIGMTAFPFFLSKYHALKKRPVPQLEILTDKAQLQTREIKAQEAQIRYFNAEMLRLKEGLTRAGRLENHVRRIANIGEVKQDNSIFGVGGSIGGDAEDILWSSEADNSGRLLSENALQVANQKRIPGQDIILQKAVRKNPNILASTPFICPVIGWETSGFGYHRSPITGSREFHRGLDIAAPPGTPVVAPADGVITFYGSKGIWGKTLIVEHGHGISTRYSHLQKSLKTVGSRVARGETVAYVGNSGKSVGPHLHYEVRLHGIPVNPKKFLLSTPSSVHEILVKESQKNHKIAF